MPRLAVDFAWERLGMVVLDDHLRLRFPVAPPGPGLYQFWFESDERPSVYIGEASDLSGERAVPRSVALRGEAVEADRLKQVVCGGSGQRRRP